MWTNTGEKWSYGTCQEAEAVTQICQRPIPHERDRNRTILGHSLIISELTLRCCACVRVCESFLNHLYCIKFSAYQSHLIPLRITKEVYLNYFLHIITYVFVYSYSSPPQDLWFSSFHCATCTCTADSFWTLCVCVSLQWIQKAGSWREASRGARRQVWRWRCPVGPSVRPATNP